MRIDRIKAELDILKLFQTISSALFGTTIGDFSCFFCWLPLYQVNKNDIKLHTKTL